MASIIRLLTKILSWLERHEAEKRQDDLNKERKKVRSDSVDYANDRWLPDDDADVPSQPPSDGDGGDERQRDSQDS